MTKIAYIFQKITFFCCCLFIKETTLSLINDFQKMFKNVQKENVSKCSCDTSPDDKVYPFTKFAFAEVIVTSDQAVLIFPFCYSVL